jgi:hypothetical protein
MVVSQADLGRAVEVRYAAYKRHAAPFAETLLAPESLDRAPGTVVLLAEDKSDHAPLGTMRIQTNAFEPLVLEQSIALPDWLRSQRLAEATRLGVAHCRIGPLVKNALFKAAEPGFSAQFRVAAARVRSRARSRSFFVSEAARTSSARASSRRPRRERKSARTAGTR